MQNYIIAVLLFLLTIVFYLYIVMVNNYDNFQKERICYIKNKTAELDEREKKVMVLEKCNNELNKCNSAVFGISTIVKGLSEQPIVTNNPTANVNNLTPENNLIPEHNLTPENNATTVSK